MTAKSLNAFSTLDQSPVRQVLGRLYAEAKENDSRVGAEEDAIAEAQGGAIDDQAREVLLERSFMAVTPEVGRLIYLLVRSRRPALIVEFGTSFGLSTIHLASALRDNGSGRLITTEQIANKAARAAQNLAEAGVSDLVEIRQGDAFQTLTDMSGIDFLMLDGWKPLYLPLLRQLEPALSEGCLIVADDVIRRADQLAPYLTYVRDAANGYTSCGIPLGDGLELSIR